MKRIGRKFIVPAALIAATFGGAKVNAGLINPGFEAYGQAPGTYGNFTDTAFSGWRTTATDHKIEVWGTGFGGVAAYEGTQFAELNANQVSTLYQDATRIAAGAQVGFQFAHRGRSGVDTMRLDITDLGVDALFGTSDDTLLFSRSYSDGTSQWGYYTDPAPITALGNTVRFSYVSVSSVGGSTYGNFLDAADFGVGVGSTAAVPEPATFLSACLAGLVAWRRWGRRSD